MNVVKLKLGVGSLLVLWMAGQSLAIFGADKTVSVEGTLVDSKCYLKDNSLTGNDHGPMNAAPCA